MESEENCGSQAFSEEGGAAGTDVPGSVSLLGRRIHHVCQHLGWSEAATHADKSVKQLKRYVQGGDPPFSVLQRLSAASGASVEWLASGNARNTLDSRLQESVLLDELAAVRKEISSSACNETAHQDLRELEALTLRLIDLNRRQTENFQLLGRHGNRSRFEDPIVDNSALSPARAMDEDLHGLVVEGIMDVYREANARLPPRDLGRLAARMYTDVAAASEDEGDDPVARRTALRMALQQLRRDFLTPNTTDQSKRRA